MSLSIGFAGLSHLGIVYSAAAAAKGFDVVGFDESAGACAALEAGEPPVVEPGLPELLRQIAPRIRYAADAAALAPCDVIFISIDVPTDADNRSDSRPVERLLALAAGVAKRGAVLVVLSQVHPGFSRRIRRSIEEAGSTRSKGLALYYQVETLVFGQAVERALAPERFMVGCADPRQPLPSSLRTFLEAFGCPVLPMRYESAELCKISINMFLVAAVSTTNMLAEVCEAVGAEWREIAPALRLDRRIGPHAYLTPGLGIGGGNLTRDLATIATLAMTHGTDAELVRTWSASSDYRREWVLRRLYRELLGVHPAPAIAVWGLAYKEHTQSTKNSPAAALLDRLAGVVAVRSFDPGAAIAADDARRWGVAASALDACDGADVLAVMTPWPEFAEVDFGQVRRRLRGDLVLDPYGRLPPDAVRSAGLRYARLGSGPLAAAETHAHA